VENLANLDPEERMNRRELLDARRSPPPGPLEGYAAHFNDLFGVRA
jgi:hypothetical protein